MNIQTTAAVGTPAAEAAILEATAKALAEGKDPFGDEDDGSEVPAAEAADADEADTADADAAATDETPAGNEDAAAAADESEGEADADPDLTAEQLAAVAKDEPAAVEAPPFKAKSPAEYAEARKELLDKRAKAFKDYSDGVIEAEAYSRIDAEVFDALEALTVERALHTANVQREAQAWSKALDTVMVAAKKAGEVDYAADAEAAKQFDQATTLLQSDGKQRTPSELATDAHRMVLALRGITAKAPAGGTRQEATEPAKPRANGKPPVTLRNVPTAEVPNNGGGWQDQMAKLTGQEYEDAFARLTPAQQAMLRGD